MLTPKQMLQRLSKANLLTGKGTIAAIQRRGTIRAGVGTIRAVEGTIRAVQDF